MCALVTGVQTCALPISHGRSVPAAARSDEMTSSAIDTTHEAMMANAIRALSMDAVEAANSGHPGMPMGMADAATVLFNRFLRIRSEERRVGKRVSVRVDLGGRRCIKKQNNTYQN